MPRVPRSACLLRSLVVTELVLEKIVELVCKYDPSTLWSAATLQEDDGMKVPDSRPAAAYVFPVGERAFCCWEHDHADRTLAFLKGVDRQYFATVAGILAAQLSTERALAASVALRALYQQGIESLMSLLGAMSQAPGCVQLWIAKCSTQDLHEIVQALTAGRPILTPHGRRRVTLEDLSHRTHQYAWVTEAGADSTAARYARLWARLAHEFLDETARAEYNAIKHGHRVSAGGFQLAIGVEAQPGVPAPAEAMRSLGGSKYGSTFFIAEPVGVSKWNLRSRRVSLNWSADALVRRLGLVSMSISNVVGALQVESGIEPGTINFVRPTPASAFDDVWNERVGIHRSSIDSVVVVRAEDELTKEELARILERRGRRITEN